MYRTSITDSSLPTKEQQLQIHLHVLPNIHFANIRIRKVHVVNLMMRTFVKVQTSLRF
jgi:hypothetical protein